MPGEIILMLGAKGMCLRKCRDYRVVLPFPKIQFNENEKIMGGKSLLQSLASCPNTSRDALALAVLPAQLSEN